MAAECDGVRKRNQERVIRARRSTRCGWKSGNVADNRLAVGVAIGVSFRKPGCGIEGKWKGGEMRVNWVPGFSLFPQGGGNGMWIYGLEEWKAVFEAGLAQVWRKGVLQGRRSVHSLHRFELDGGNADE
jgi:hypothetical protein